MRKTKNVNPTLRRRVSDVDREGMVLEMNTVRSSTCTWIRPTTPDTHKKEPKIVATVAGPKTYLTWSIGAEMNFGAKTTDSPASSHRRQPINPMRDPDEAVMGSIDKKNLSWALLPSNFRKSRAIT